MNEIVITGSRGFIGTNLRETFLNHQIPFAEYDLSIGLDQRSITGHDGILIHLAAWRKEDESFWKAEEYIQNNVNGLAKIIASNRFSGIVFASSSAVYDQDGQLEPRSIYGLTKLFGEKLIRLYNKNHWILRMFHPYGPHDHLSVFHKLAQCKKTGETFRLHWSDNLKRDYFHVDHVCDTIMLILNDVIKPGTYNIGTGKTIYASKFLLELCEKHKIKYEKVTIPIGTSTGFIPESDYIYGGERNLEAEWLKYL